MYEAEVGVAERWSWDEAEAIVEAVRGSASTKTLLFRMSRPRAVPSESRGEFRVEPLRVVRLF